MTDPSGQVVILDRDGTLVIDRGYLDDPDGLEFEPHAVEALQWFHARGFRLVVITNQSGVGRGYFPVQRVLDMNERLYAMTRAVGVPLAGIYFCPHAPEAQCDCRKPALGLMRRAASELDFDPASAIVIGDKDSDVEFGRLAGATTVLIAARAPEGGRVRPDVVAPHLMDAVRALESRLRAGTWSLP